MDLHERLGFNSNPFATFSAEEEGDFIDEVFVRPLYLNSLKNDISNGHSRFILGARGVGKTSLVMQLRTYCNNNYIFSVIVDDYEGVKLTDNKADILLLMIENITRDYCITLSKNPHLIRPLSRDDKEKLSFIIECFFRTISKGEFEDRCNSVTHFKAKNFFKKILNILFNKPINIFISGVVEILSTTVRSSLGLPDPNKEDFYKSYLPEFSTERPTASQLNDGIKSDEKALKRILMDLSQIINNSGLGKPVILFDKIDEYPSLSGNTTSISNFIEAILKDTTLLLNQSYSLVFSLWDAIRTDLNSKGVRFDKIKPVDISWSNEQLIEMFDKRLSYFSDGLVDSIKFIQDDDARNRIIKLANGSPRYLFRLLSVIYDQQCDINPEVDNIQAESIALGMKQYCLLFEFYAAFPGKRGSKDDVMISVNRLLKIGSLQITTKDFVNEYKVSTGSALNYIKSLLEFSLIKKIGNDEGKTYLYEVTHPVIKHMIEQGINSID